MLNAQEGGLKWLKIYRGAGVMQDSVPQLGSGFVRRQGMFDAVIAEADIALQVLSGAVRAKRPNPAGVFLPSSQDLDASQKRHAAGLMRVNHVGEICAQALYRGQSAVCQDVACKGLLLDAAAEEVDHLAWCGQRLAELDARPSVLNPIWYAGSFLLGALAGRSGVAHNLGFMAETERQVEQHRRRNDRNAGHADLDADAAGFQPAHHAAGRIQPEGAAAREHYRMHPVHQVDRREQVGLARAGRRAAHVHAGHRALAREHHAAACGAARVGEVADLDACHIANAVGGLAHALSSWARALSAQMVRLNTVASNLANAGTVSGSQDSAFRALRPVFEARYDDAMAQTGLSTAEATGVVMLDRVPEREFRPDHPSADKDGFVWKAAVNPDEEMVEMLELETIGEKNGYGGLIE